MTTIFLSTKAQILRGIIRALKYDLEQRGFAHDDHELSDMNWDEIIKIIPIIKQAESYIQAMGYEQYNHMKDGWRDTTKGIYDQMVADEYDLDLLLMREFDFDPVIIEWINLKERLNRREINITQYREWCVENRIFSEFVPYNTGDWYMRTDDYNQVCFHKEGRANG